MVNNRWMIGVFSLCAVVMTVSFLRLSSHVQHSLGNAGVRSAAPPMLAGLIGTHADDDSTVYGISKIVHPADEATPTPVSDGGTIKSKLDECESNWMTHFVSSLHWPTFEQPKRGREPMSVKNARHAAITLKMIPGMPHRRSVWKIGSGTTWKFHTPIGQRWLVADHDRCLFYVTAGDEPLHMVVRSQ